MNTCEVATVYPRHYQELSKYLSSFPRETRTSEFWLDRFQLWWDQNPAFSNSLERGWVLCDKNRIKGFLAAIPSKIQLFNNDVTVSSMSTWRVNVKNRKDSLKLLTKFISFIEYELLFSTTPNFMVRKILQNFGFQLLPKIDSQHTAIIIDVERVLDFKLQQYVPNLSSKLFHSGKINGLYEKCILQRRKLFYEVKSVSYADNSFDKLWKKTRHQYELTNVRTSEILNWYCFSNPNHQKVLLGCYHNDQLLGYIVLWERIRPGRQLECLDLWLNFSDYHVLESLLSGTIDYAISNSFVHAIFPHFNREVSDALRLGIRRTSLMKRKDYFQVSYTIGKEISNVHSYFTLAQGDVGL